jgi:hypothetical protein
MKIISKQLPMNHNLFFSGDEHLGSNLHYTKGLDTLLDMIQSPYGGLPARNNFSALMGDPIEAILIDDKRFHPSNYASLCEELEYEDIDDRKHPIPRLQAEYYARRMNPIKDRILFILDSNHNIKLWKYDNFTAYIAKQLGVEYGTWTCKCRVESTKGRYLYKFYATHGAKTIQSYADDISRRVANEKLILKRQLSDQAGDCVLMAKGHSHKLIVSHPEKRLYLTDDGKYIQQRYTGARHTDEEIHPDHRWYINTGSFHRTFAEGVTGYAERFEYKPVELGFIVVMVRDGVINSIVKEVV